MKNVFITSLVTFVFMLQAATAGDIWFIRHAEKEAGPDPVLSGEGLIRAERYAEFFADKNIQQIYSTNTKRTIATVEPLAQRLGLLIENYDPDQLENFGQSLCAMGVNIIVSGHSNTTPLLVNAVIGKDKFKPHDEKDYDTAYKIDCAKRKLTVSQSLKGLD